MGYFVRDAGILKRFKCQGIRQTALRPHITVNNVRNNVRKVRVF